MDYVYVGKIVNTHGIKGEVRILSDFRYKDRIFKKGFTLYIGKNKEMVKINSYRYHKVFDMICMDGYSDINMVLKFKGENVYILRGDLVLFDSEYLDSDLIGIDLYEEDKLVGKIKRIDKYKAHDIIVVEGINKNYLIPYVKEFVKSIDIDNSKVIINKVEGLIE